LLTETFPNVQFIVTAHSPLVATQCFEDQAAVLRKVTGDRFSVERNPLLIDRDLAGIIRNVFDTDPTNAVLSKYSVLLGNRLELGTRIKETRSNPHLSEREEADVRRDEAQLERLNRADRAIRQEGRIEVLEEYEATLLERVQFFEQELKSRTSQPQSEELSTSLGRLSEYLSGTKDSNQVATTIGYAVDMYRQLAHDNPGRFMHDLAVWLAYYSKRLGEIGEIKEALDTGRESVEIYRKLSEDARYAVELERTIEALRNLER
jgi:hypothetical protein